MKNIGVISSSKRWPRIPNNGLQIYLDAGIVDSYPGSGTQWRDISGNNRHFTWSSTSFVSDGQLSYFNTDGRVATGPASNSCGIPDGSYTIFFIGLTTTLTTNAVFKFHKNGASGADRRAIFVHPTWSGSPATFYFDQGGCCALSQRVSGNIDGQHNQRRLWFVRRGFPGRQIFRGTTLVAQNNFSAAANITMNATAVQINPNDEGYNWVGRIHAFGAYNRLLTDAELSSVYAYFQTRGLTN